MALDLIQQRQEFIRQVLGFYTERGYPTPFQIRDTSFTARVGEYGLICNGPGNFTAWIALGEDDDPDNSVTATASTIKKAVEAAEIEREQVVYGNAPYQVFLWENDHYYQFVVARYEAEAVRLLREKVEGYILVDFVDRKPRVIPCNALYHEQLQGPGD